MNLQSIGVEDVITVLSSGDTDVIQVGTAMNVRCGYAHSGDAQSGCFLLWHKTIQ